MPAAVKLALPLLRTATPWWFWLLMVIWATLAGITDDAQLGSAISVGGAVLLMLAIALGMNLRHCRSRSLATVLPGFDRSGLAATGGILLGLIAVFAGLDVWGVDSLVALITASALGLGVGLCLPAAGLPLLIALMFFALGWGATALNIIWTGSWSPAAALGLLALGLTLYRYRGGPRWLTGLDRLEGEWTRASARDAKRRGRDPYRSGYLFGHWRLALASLVPGVALGLLAIGTLNEEGSSLSRLDPDMARVLAYFLALFAGAGVLSLLIGLLTTGQSTLRKLAVLPGWHRERLFRHAELSCWRCALAALLALGATLALISLWTGQLDYRLWLTTLGFVGGFYLLGIYLALWLMRERLRTLAKLALVIVLCPLFSVQWWMFSGLSDHPLTVDRAWLELSPIAALFAVFGLFLLVWWLRRSAQLAWRSIDFLRNT